MSEGSSGNVKEISLGDGFLSSAAELHAAARFTPPLLKNRN